MHDGSLAGIWPSQGKHCLVVGSQYVSFLHCASLVHPPKGTHTPWEHTCVALSQTGLHVPVKPPEPDPGPTNPPASPPCPAVPVPPAPPVCPGVVGSPPQETPCAMVKPASKSHVPATQYVRCPMPRFIRSSCRSLSLDRNSSCSRIFRMRFNNNRLEKYEGPRERAAAKTQ